jgi:hypothetical protein
MLNHYLHLLNKLDKYKMDLVRLIEYKANFKIQNKVNSTDYLSLILIFAGVMSALSSLES